jgi:hypothetical protein
MLTGKRSWIMTMRAIEFVENWASENVAADQQATEIASARALAARCLEDARAVGIPQSEIEEAFDDLPAFLAGEIEEARAREADRSAAEDE